MPVACDFFDEKLTLPISAPVGSSCLQEFEFLWSKHFEKYLFCISATIQSQRGNKHRFRILIIVAVVVSWCVFIQVLLIKFRHRFVILIKIFRLIYMSVFRGQFYIRLVRLF